jgi:hypothetical protein
MKYFFQHLTLLAGVAAYVVLASPESAFAQATSDQANPATPAASSQNPEAIYTQLLSQLMRVRLERIKQLNTQVPGTFSPDDIAVSELQLKAVDQLEQQAKSSKEIDWFSMVLIQAQISKTAADLDWKHAAKLRQQSVISDADAEMSHLRAQLAAVNLERGEAVEKKSADDRQNWALQYLVMEVQSLQDKVARLEERE